MQVGFLCMYWVLLPIYWLLVLDYYGGNLNYYEMRASGRTCCGVVSRGQHWGPLRQTDYTASLPLSSWKPNHQCASTDPATIPSLREDQVAKATLNASRQVLFFNHDGLYEGQWVTPTCPRATDRKNTRGWRGSLVLIISRICCTHPLQPQCPVVYLTLCN